MTILANSLSVDFYQRSFACSKSMSQMGSSMNQTSHGFESPKMAENGMSIWTIWTNGN
jgi:hypothetical protein